MIWQIDTSKIPDKQMAFWAELIIASYKSDCTINESIEEMRNILKSKKE